jgi:hypothetical protein
MIHAIGQLEYRGRLSVVRIGFSVLAFLVCSITNLNAQTIARTCEYFNSADNKSFEGPCLETRTTKDAELPYTIKITMPGADLEIKYLKRQGPYHRWSINGASAAAYEIDRTHLCGFTDDLGTSICIKSEGGSRKPTAEAPVGIEAKPFFVGKWHIDNRRLCRGRPGETEGLLTYTEREFIGLENRCQILKTTPQANRIELALKCSGEGASTIEREVVQLLRNGRLSRTIFDGKRPQTFEYARCP